MQQKEKFRVIDMLMVRTKAYLVIFSACVSGTGMTNKGDDVLGFSHAMLAGRSSRRRLAWAANAYGAVLFGDSSIRGAEVTGRILASSNSYALFRRASSDRRSLGKFPCEVRCHGSR